MLRRVALAAVALTDAVRANEKAAGPGGARRLSVGQQEKTDQRRC